MAYIRKLADHEIRLIAAGEVIERPASIVKELVENSIDAGSTSIEIYVKDGGKTEIKVIDNGKGMSSEDAHMALELHTTSKFELKDDKFDITTYGFRGEALAALSSVAKICVVTRDSMSDHGICMKKAHAGCVDFSVVGSSHGTTIEVSELFDAVPARKKFLKSRETEWNALAQVIVGLACANAHIRFHVVHDDRIIYQLPSTDTLEKRIKALSPDYVNQHLISCTYRDDYVCIDGMITSFEYGHYDRSHIFCIINGRPVKHYKMTQSIIKGFQGSLPAHRYPVACISLTIDPSHVDCNVHPRKEEVAFIHPKKVENAISEAVISSLERSIKKRAQKPVFDSNIFQKNVPEKSLYVPEIKSYEKYEKNSEYVKNDKNEDAFLFDNQMTPVVKFENTPSFIASEYKHNVPEYKQINFDSVIAHQEVQSKFMGIISSTYLLFDVQDGLLMIDQHALHERILYEQLCESNNASKGNPLITPLAVTFDSYALKILSNRQDILDALGIECDFFNESTIIVRSCSSLIVKMGVENALKTIASLASVYISKKDIQNELLRDINAMIACKAAVKAGDILSQDQVAALIKDMQKYQCTSICPHGRPTSYLMRYGEIERLFKRKA